MHVVRKVLHVGPGQTRGGMGSSIRRLRKHPPNGWSADVLTTHADGGIIAILRAWNNAKRKLAGKLAEKPDLVHVHSATRASWFRKRKIIRKAQRKGIPVIVHLHSGSFDRFGKGWIGKDISRILSLDGVYPVVLSEYWKEWLDPMISNDVRIVPNPYRYGLSPTSFEKRDINLLLMVGRPSRIKGHSLAINAVHELRKEGIDVVLQLVGTSKNNLPKNLRTKDGFIAKGWVEEKELDVLINRAGFLLMPSEHEGMPLSLLDGLSTGLPAIVSDACSSFINEGGIVIKERSVNAWKEEIRNQIHNRKEWEKMVLNAPNDVYGLDPDSDKLRWEKVYEEIIENHSKIE